MAYPRDERDDLTRPELHAIQMPDLAPAKPDPGWHRGYTRYFRRLDKVVMTCFVGMKVVDDKLVPYNIPVVLGTMEKIVYSVYGESAPRNDDGQPKKVRLPIIGLIPGSVDMDLDRYTYHEAMTWERYVSERRPNDVVLGETIGIPIVRPYTVVVLTRYYEDHMQLVDQILQRFSPTMEVRVAGNFFESTIEYGGSSSNFSETTPEDSLRLYRTEVTISVKGWLPQPLRREKTTLGIKIETGVGDPTTLGGFHKSSRFLVRARPNDQDAANDRLPPR
jgi:hypothetical protein